MKITITTRRGESEETHSHSRDASQNNNIARITFGHEQKCSEIQPPDGRQMVSQINQLFQPGLFSKCASDLAKMKFLIHLNRSGAADSITIRADTHCPDA